MNRWKLILVAVVLALAPLGLAGPAQASPRAWQGTDPPLCRLVPAVLQNSQGGQSTAWFNWCGMGPDAPEPVKGWVARFIGDGFTFDASQCPKVNPCTIYGVP